MPDAADVPSDYAEVTLAIEGKADVTAYQKADDELYLIYCINDRGEKGWYQYDPVEETYIRYVAPVETVEQVVEAQNPDTELQAEVANLKLERTIILAVCGIILVILLIIIIALAIRVANLRKDVLRELEEEDSEDELDEELFVEEDKQEQDDEIINLDISDDSTDVDNIADMVIADAEGANIVSGDVDNENSYNSNVNNEDTIANKDIIDDNIADMKMSDVVNDNIEIGDESADSELTESESKKEKKKHKRWGKKKEKEPEEDDDITFIDL